MFVVGLTGGIGSGKTAVSKEFEKHGVCVVDADIGARAIVEKGSPVLTQIKDAFTTKALTTSGELNRPFLRDLIFSNAQARKTLDNITHPAIRAWMVNELKKSTSAYAVLVIPLLTNKQTWGGMMHRILVVDVDENTQIERVMQRDKQTREQAQNAIASQINRKNRLALADDIILNNRDLAHIKQCVKQLHTQYLHIAQAFSHL